MSAFADLRLNHAAAQTDESFWPSFTDIMAVVVMIFLITTSVLILRNWDLLRQVSETVAAERRAMELARATSEAKTTAEEQLEEAQRVIALLRMELTRAREQRQRSDSLIAEQGDQIGRLEAAQARLQAELAQESSAKADLGQKLDALAQQFAVLQVEQEGTRSELERTRSDLQLARTELGSTRGQLEGTRSELGRTQAELRTTREQLEQTRGSLETTRSDLQSAGAELERAREELRRSGSELQAAREELQRTGSELLAARTALQRAGEELEGARGELQATRGELRDTRGELEAARDELQATGSELQAARTALQRTGGELLAVQGELSSTRGELESARGELRRTGGALEQTRGELREAGSELARASAELEQQRQRVAQLQREAQRTASSLSEAQRGSREQQREIAQLREAATQVEARFAALVGDYDDLKIKYDKLIKPARSARGKYVVEVRYLKSGGEHRLSLREPSDDEFRSVELAELHQVLTGLRDKYPDDLYVRILFPEDSGLSYSEAWSFTHDLLGRYDYYHRAR